MTERPGACIWWLEDDRELCRLLVDQLRACGWKVSLFHQAKALTAALQRHEPDLLLLDRLLPGTDGLDLLLQLRRDHSSFPVLILSGLGAPDQRIEGLALGAHDYLSKPFRLQELVLRIERLLQVIPPRQRPPCLQESELAMGPLRLDRQLNCLRDSGDGVLRLSRGDAALLQALLQTPGMVLSREQLARASGSLVDVSSSRSLDVRLSRLRRQLRQLSLGAVSVEAVRGRGYRLTLPAQTLPQAALVVGLLPAQLALPTLLLALLLVALAALLGWTLWRQLLQPLTQLRSALTVRAPDLSIAPLSVAGIRPLRQLVARLNVLHAGQSMQTAEQHERLQTLIHDLRAPMTRLTLRLEALRADRAPGLELMEGLSSDLELIIQLQQQLGHLFEGPSPVLAPELVALDELCRRITRHYPHDCIALAVPHLILRVEVELLHRVLHNLIDNALDHGGTPVLIRAQVLAGGVVLEVKDQGRHRQAPMAHSEQTWPHQGLGLVTALDFCRRHGGRLELEPQPSGGLLVRLWMDGRCLEIDGSAALTGAEPAAP